MRHFQKRIVVFLVALFTLAIGGLAFGQGKYPEKPITLIVHAGAGGGGDIFARTLASGIDKDKLLPQPIVVENKPGGGGGIAFTYVASKKKDPYFILTAVTNFLTSSVMGRIPLGLKDFTPIANFAFDEYMLIVNANSKYKSMKDLIADAKANPKKISVGGAAPGSADSICIYIIEKAAGVEFNKIIYKSGGEINAALMGGHVVVAMTNPGEALEGVKAGKTRILGVLSEKRLPSAPNVATMKEQGFSAIYAQNRGIVAPADIPAMPGRFWSKHSLNTPRLIFTENIWPTTCFPMHGWTVKHLVSGKWRKPKITRPSSKIWV